MKNSLFLLAVLNLMFSIIYGQTNIWTGNTSTDWFTSTNWSLSVVPTIAQDVRIPTVPTGPNWPEISSGTALARTLTIQTGAELTMNGGVLEIHRNFTKTGNFYANAGKVVFKSSTFKQTLTGITTFYDLELANTAPFPQDTVIFSDNIIIKNDITFTSGKTKPGTAGESNTITVEGNWISNGGTYIPNLGLVVFDGNQDKQILGTSTNATNFYNVSIQKSSGYSALTSTLFLKIDNSLEVQNGEMVFNNIGSLPTATVAQDVRMFEGSGIMLNNTTGVQNVELQIGRSLIDFNTAIPSRNLVTNVAYGINFTDGNALITMNSSSNFVNQSIIGYGLVTAQNTGNNLQKGLRLPSLKIATESTVFIENEGIRTIGLLRVEKGTLKANGKKIILGNLTGTNIVTNTGILDFDGGSFLMMSTNSTTGPLLRVENGGTLRLVGTDLSNIVRINRDGGSGQYYRINIESGGNFAARFYSFSLLHAEGLLMKPGSILADAPNNFSDGAFNETNAGATVRYMVLQQDFPSDITISNVRFNQTNTVFNCSRPAGAVGNVIFFNCTGVKSGPGFEEDPADPTPSSIEPDNDGKIRWNNSFVVRQWTGATSNNWNEAGNWVGGFIPTATEDALIPAGCPRYPILELNVTINNLKITANQAGAIFTTNGYNLTVNGDLTKTTGTNGNITVSAGSTLSVKYNFLIDAAHLNAINGSWVEFTGSSSIDKVFSFANLRINGNVFVSNTGSNTVIKQNIELNSGNLVFVNQNCNIHVEGNWVNNGGRFTHVGGRVYFRSANNTLKTIQSGNETFGTVLVMPSTGGCTYQLLDDMTCVSTATGVGTSGNSLSIRGNNDAGAVIFDLNGKTLTVNHILIDGNTTGTAAVYHATLLASAGSTLRINPGYTLTTAGRTPRIQMLGTASQRVTITKGSGVGTYSFSANTATAGFPLLVEAIYTDFEYFDGNGIHCAGANVNISTTNNFSYCSFTNFTQVAGTMLQLPNVLLNNIMETRFTFVGTPVPGTHFNVFRSGAGTGAATFVNSVGSLKGVTYEKDNTGPNTPGNIIWIDNNIYWGPFASGDWNDMPTKWRDGAGNPVPIPTSTDNVVLDHTHQPTPYVITNNSGATCKDLIFMSSNQSITLNNNSLLSINGNLQFTSNYDSLYANTGGNINIAGNWLTTTGNFIPATNTTVTFSGNSSTINTADYNSFENITINSPGNTIKLTSPITIKGNLNLTNGTLDVGTNNNRINLKVNWVGSSNGFFIAREGTVALTGTGLQTITNPNAQRFFSLEINKPSSSVSLNHHIYINSTLYFNGSNKARIITGSNIVRMGESASVVGINPAGTNGFVDKRMSYIFKSSTTKWFRSYTLGVNSFIDYLPVDLNLQLANNTETEILIEQFNAAPPSRTYPTLPEDVILNSTAHYFTVTNMTGTPITSCDITLRYNYKDMQSLGTTNASVLRILKENSIDNTLWDNLTPLTGAYGNSSYGFHISTVNITGFSDFVIGRIDNPLPVELLNFEAHYNKPNKNVNIQWLTLNEKNNAGFIIHKSSDLNNWVEIQNYKWNSDLIGKGTTSNANLYQTTDSNIQTGVFYYKLIQEDYDGNQTQSGIASVTIPNDFSSISSLVNYPNPFQNQHNFQIELNQKDFIEIKIMDLTGRVVKTLISQEFESGNYSFEWKPENEPFGLYLYQINTSKENFMGKLIYRP